MQIPRFYIFTLSTLFFRQSLELTAIPNPIPSSDTSTPIARALTVGLINSTLSIPHLPEGFDVKYEIGGPKLRVTSCLMNAVAALKELSLGEWDGKIIDGTEYMLDSYPEVSIIVTTLKRKRSIKAGYVTWALCYGMYDMVSKNKFEFAQFEMWWQGQKLGWVQIVNHPPRPGLTVEQRQSYAKQDLGNKSATWSSANKLASITNVVIPDNVNDPTDARLNVSFAPYGDKLGIFDVFVPVIRGLADMAKIPNSYGSSGLIISLDGFDGIMCFSPSLPLRTRPPTLNYGWLKRTIARIPTYMLGRGRFGEISIIITVDGVNVGYGRMSTAPKCNDGDPLPVSLGVEES